MTVKGFLTSSLLLLNLRHVLGHIKRELQINNVLGDKNVEVCRDSLMNSHWRELMGKVEVLFCATDHPCNYYIHIQSIIHWSSNDEE